MLEHAVFTHSLWNLQRSRPREQLTQWVSNSRVCEWVLLIPLSQTIASRILQSDMMYSVWADHFITSVCIKASSDKWLTPTPTISFVLECLNKFKCLSFWPKHWQPRLSKSDHFEMKSLQVILIIIIWLYQQHFIGSVLHCTEGHQMTWSDSLTSSLSLLSPVLLIKEKMG